ncbi:uncharacterized protein METZ01_LOCUS100003 [marine metagenome]|uniref:Uncharacterized protein n=1 Tax=marine metagenome TaxID=408172 RepID=A0A381W3M6_9ZZZZ
MAFDYPWAYSSRSCEARFVEMDKTTQGPRKSQLRLVLRKLAGPHARAYMFNKLLSGLFALRLPV